MQSVNDLTPHEFGILGEKMAQKYFKSQNYRLLHTNWRSGKFGEVDIIARDPNGEIAFIEVKARRGIRQGFPNEAVNWVKAQKLRHLTEYYFQKHPRELAFDTSFRIDIFSILFDEQSNHPTFLHLKAAV